MKTVNVLGVEYRIEIRKMSEDKTLQENMWAGYCCSDIPLIILADYDDNQHFDFVNEADKDNYAKACLRHEIIHAFLNESGLKDNANISGIAWSKNEEMVDWIAVQFPKILKAYQEVGAL